MAQINKFSYTALITPRSKSAIPICSSRNVILIFPCFEFYTHLNRQNLSLDTMSEACFQVGKEDLFSGAQTFILITKGYQNEG